MMLRRLMCGVGKKQIHDMSLNNEPSAALQRTLKHCCQWRIKRTEDEYSTKDNRST